MGDSEYSNLLVSINDSEGLKRLFRGIDKNQDGYISFQDFLFFIAILNNPKPEELIQGKKPSHFTF